MWLRRYSPSGTLLDFGAGFFRLAGGMVCIHTMPEAGRGASLRVGGGGDVDGKTQRSAVAAHMAGGVVAGNHTLPRPASPGG